MYEHIFMEMDEAMQRALDSLDKVGTGTQHKHHEVIKAWAEGRPIQHRYVSDLSEWNDWNYANNYTPPFNDTGVDWRIRPKTETIRYTNALYFNGIKYWIEAIMEDEFSLDLSADKEFVRCIGEWQTIEVEK